MQTTWRLILNIGLFQAGWFACLLLSLPWALLVVISALIVHFFVIVPCEKRLSEFFLITVVLAVGVVLESVYLWSHALIRTDSSLTPPIWLLFIWVLFATTFRYSLSWLRAKLLLAAVFAGVAAPMSYFAGANLNTSVSLNENIVFSLAVVAVTWAIAFPLMMKKLVPEGSHMSSNSQ
ncbi:MAG: hypothetical protein ACI8VC_001929 [Candidatus Endobugula sp.]|jgi:hypothetical protein